MAYVHRLINDDEKLIGIARLHWIYILQGLLWFLGLAAAGLALSWLMNRGMAALTGMGGDAYVPTAILGLSGGIMLFMLAAGAMIFLFYVVKVLATQIALTDRRIIQKKGLIFVNVHQIDLEEIRGENMDLGVFGRIFGYAYIMLDCRFIGDVRLDAIERPERFIRALHDRRAHTQDAINLVVGKSSMVNPVNFVQQGEGADQPEQPQQPEVEPPQTQPEIQQPQPDQVPPSPNRPMPNQPPPVDGKENAKNSEDRHEQKTAHQKEQDRDRSAWENDGKVKAAMTQRIEKLKRELMEDLTVNQNRRDDMKAPESLQQLRARGGEEPVFEPNKTPGEMGKSKAPDNEQKAAPAMTQEEIAKVVEQVTPQIAQQVVKEMTEQGLIKAPEPESDNNVDNDLIHVFDEAALEKDEKPHDNRNSLEHSIH